jgi:hypothetical protein
VLDNQRRKTVAAITEQDHSERLSFNIDLVAEDEGGGTIIIEDQLGKSDHDHLGKLITYLTGMSARRRSGAFPIRGPSTLPP